MVCQSRTRNKKRKLKCAHLNCNKVFLRAPHNSRNENLYCSRSCAISANNTKYPRKKAVVSQCALCHEGFRGNQLYCSFDCKNKSQIISSEEIREKIKAFYNLHGRIPFKREFLHYNAARDRFGSWNNAILASGFDPNPVKFTKKHLARDGHSCDSLAEKIIDDWLYGRNIKHERNVSYPDNPKLTADFVTQKHWVEFFGLFGELKNYDALVRKKQKLARKYKLPLVELYPKDLFPISRLSEKII